VEFVRRSKISRHTGHGRLSSKLPPIAGDNEVGQAPASHLGGSVMLPEIINPSKANRKTKTTPLIPYLLRA